MYLFLEIGEGREKKRERNINLLPLTQPCLCPDVYADKELSRRLFGLQASTQSTAPHQPGPYWSILSLRPHMHWHLDCEIKR